MPKKTKSPERSQAAALLGSKGGKAGAGASKRRDPEHYGFVLAEARRTARTKRKLA